MSNLPGNKKKFPWLQVGIIALILVIVAGIYIVKNASASNEDNEAVQDQAAAQVTENSLQTNTENNSDSALPSEQDSSAQTSEQSSTTDQNSQQNSSSLPKLVDLGSNTCIPCQEMAPILEELKNEYTGKVDVEVVDVYEDEEKTMEYNAKHPLSVIPTQILFDAKGNEVWSHEGSLPKEDIIKVFNEKLGVK